MKVDHITYSESHELFSEFGLKKWKKLEVGATLSEGEDDQLAAKELKEKVKLMLTPELVPIPEALQGVLPVSQVDSQNGKIDGLVEAIKSCTSLVALDRFKPMIERENVDILYEAYNNKKIELQ